MSINHQYLPLEVMLNVTGRLVRVDGRRVTKSLLLIFIFSPLVESKAVIVTGDRLVVENRRDRVLDALIIVFLNWVSFIVVASLISFWNLFSTYR